MNSVTTSRREFLKAASVAAGAFIVSPAIARRVLTPLTETATPDYVLHIRNSAVEIAPKRFVAVTTYNGQFPGPLLRFKVGQQATIDIFNDTDAPEQLHWHGQRIPTDVDGAAEEGTPFIPAQGKRRITFTPNPASLRFYPTHNRAGADLAAGQYSGQVGPVLCSAATRKPKSISSQIIQASPCSTATNSCTWILDS